MPLLKGGARHRHGVKPRGTRVRKIKRKKLIDVGTEAGVFEVEVEVRVGKRKKIVKMVEKEFRNPIVPASYELYPYGNPLMQFNIMNKLIKLNRSKKLGLRIIPTIRLRKIKGKKPRLVLTLLKNVLKEVELTPKQKKEFERDALRQQLIGKKNGYYILEDVFFPVIDSKTGKCLAVIGDFGGIRRIGKNE
jgi:hypothetical protein